MNQSPLPTHTMAVTYVDFCGVRKTTIVKDIPRPMTKGDALAYLHYRGIQYLRLVEVRELRPAAPQKMGLLQRLTLVGAVMFLGMLCASLILSGTWFVH